jgi:PleD family two-component response regulator
MLKQNNTLRRAHVRMKLLATDLQASKEKLQVQNRRLQYDAYHDSLTGMPNRSLSGNVCRRSSIRCGPITARRW